MGGEKKTLFDFTIIEMGQSPPGESCNSMRKGLPLLNGPTEFGSHHPVPVQWTTDPKRIAQPGDILFCVRGSTTGRMNWADQKYAIGRGIAAIRPKVLSNTSHFIKGVIEYNLPDLLAAATGSTFPNVSKQQLYGLPFPEIKAEDQISIANILSSLDDKIELNRRINRTLEETAQALFRSWFVDFDPVKAKARANELGCDPERAAMAAIAGKLRVPKNPEELTAEDFAAAEVALASLTDEQRAELAETAALFPAALVDSELGLIPEGWEVKLMNELVNLTMGQSPKSEFYNEEGNGLPFHQGVTDYGSRFPTHRVFCTSENRLAQLGDILLSVRAPVGRINLADQKIVIGRGLAALRHKKDMQSFLLYFLKDRFQKEDSIGSGTIFNSVTKKELESLPFLSPRIELLQSFELIVTPIDLQIARLDSQSITLTLLRDTLLPKLLSGEVTVGEATEQVEQSC